MSCEPGGPALSSGDLPQRDYFSGWIVGPWLVISPALHPCWMRFWGTGLRWRGPDWGIRGKGWGRSSRRRLREDSKKVLTEGQGLDDRTGGEPTCLWKAFPDIRPCKTGHREFHPVSVVSGRAGPIIIQGRCNLETHG